MEGQETTVLKKGRKVKKTEKTPEDKNVKKVSARQRVKKNKNGLIGLGIGAALGVVGTYFYMREKAPKA